MKLNFYILIILIMQLKAHDNTSGIGDVAGTKVIKNTDQKTENENPIKNITPNIIPENNPFPTPVNSRSGKELD